MTGLREIVLDTETTGMEPLQGDRIVEIGCVELVNHLPTGRTWHVYLDPQRDMPEAAFRVHGLSSEFLAGKPVFVTVADEFLAFIDTAPLVIHNASFDMQFLNAELARAKRPQIPADRAIDTLAIAQRRHPGGPNNLDALCRRYAVDRSARTLHGALLDSQLLAEVYLHLLGGRQVDLGLTSGHAQGDIALANNRKRPMMAPRPHAASARECEAHAAFIGAFLGEKAIWND